MGYKYVGDIYFDYSLEVNRPKPLDARSVVAKKEDLITLDPATAYEGMSVVVIEDRNIYILIDKTNISSYSGWQAISSSDGNSESVDLSNYYTKADSDTRYYTKSDSDNKFAKVTALANYLANGSNGTLASLTVDSIKSSYNLSISANSLLVNNKSVATTDLLFKYEVLSELEYNALLTKDPDTYYFIYSDAT